MTAGLDDNPEYDVTTLRLDYESMVTPGIRCSTIIMADGKRLESVEGSGNPVSGYDPSPICHRTCDLITARDGAKVPVSVLMTRKASRKDGSQPLHLYAYGAYGYADAARVQCQPPVEPGRPRLCLCHRAYPRR